jgi:hypothetical protein
MRIQLLCDLAGEARVGVQLILGFEHLALIRQAQELIRTLRVSLEESLARFKQLTILVIGNQGFVCRVKFLDLAPDLCDRCPDLLLVRPSSSVLGTVLTFA